jgi:hypothetical protein
MTPRLSRSAYEQQKGDGKRRALRRLLSRGRVPGLLAYLDDRPVGWCSVEPREAFGMLARSRILRPVDDQRVWLIVCFFVHKDDRGSG